MKRPVVVVVVVVVALVALTLAGGALAAVKRADRSRPPEPKEPEPWRAPAPERFTLENGVPVFLLERHQVPLVDVVVVVQAGAADDPLGLPGTSSWTSAMLTEGAGALGSLELADAVDFLGADLDADAGWESSQVSLHVPSPRLDDGLALLADVVLRPTFPAKEWERIKEEKRTEFLQWQDSPYALSQLARDRALWGEHRYGFPRSGLPASLERVRLDELAAFHRARYTADNAFVVVVGDVTRAQAKELLEQRLGSWGKATAAPLAALGHAPPPAATTRVVLVDKPGAPQSVVAAVMRAPDDLEPLDPAVEVMNTLLGGSFTSRLNQNLREEHQYSYGARSSFELRDAGSAFVAASSVATPVTAPAVSEIVKELRRMRSYVEDSEAERASGYLALTFPTSFDSGRATAGFWAWAIAKGVAPSRVERFAERALRQRERHVLEAGRRALPMTGLIIVVVGDRAVVEPELKALGLGPIEVVSAAELIERTP